MDQRNSTSVKTPCSLLTLYWHLEPHLFTPSITISSYPSTQNLSPEHNWVWIENKQAKKYSIKIIYEILFWLLFSNLLDLLPLSIFLGNICQYLSMSQLLWWGITLILTGWKFVSLKLSGRLQGSCLACDIV